MALQRDLQSSLWFSYSRSMVGHPEAMPTLSPLLVCEAGPQSVEPGLTFPSHRDRG